MNKIDNKIKYSAELYFWKNEIKNYLYLMDPFVTSGRDMIINDKMKKDFIPVLEAHEKLLKELSK